MKHTLFKRVCALFFVLAMLAATACAAPSPAPSPTPMEETVGTPTPSARPAPTATPLPIPTVSPDFTPGTAESVLPAAQIQRYLRNGVPENCPHGTPGLCEICISEGALPLPDAGRIQAILRFLTAESRRSGSEHGERSGELIQQVLTELGYSPKIQPVGTENTGYVFSGESAVAFGETLLPAEYVFGSAQGVRTGPAVLCGEGYPLPETAEGSVLITADITILNIIHALQLGTPGAVVVRAGAQEAEGVPALWPDAVVLATGENGLLDAILPGQEVLASSLENGPFSSANIIAEINPDGGETLIFTAHYDSVATSPGANDNAAGVALLLELARIFRDVQTDQRIVFLFTTGEEQGMLGARVFARELSEDDRRSIAAVFTLDMFADANQPLPLVYTCDGEPDRAVGLLLLACDAFNLQKPLLGKESRSDHAAFYAVGLPAALIAQSESDALYHTPYDTMEKLSSGYIDLVCAWMGGVILRDARSN